jgi:hypothetical protein
MTCGPLADRCPSDPAAQVAPTGTSAAATTPTEVNLGQPIITTLIDGRVVASSARPTQALAPPPGPPGAAPVKPAITRSSIEADIDLFAGMGNIIAAVTP